jgi:hypothetical protein
MEMEMDMDIDMDSEDQLTEKEEMEEFLEMMNDSYRAYLNYGPRSSKKVDIIHNFIFEELSCIFIDERYEVLMEENVPASNSSGMKRCDICVYDNIKKQFILVVPVKFICSNYKQNKNNYLENCIGECFTLKYKNSYL